MSSVRNKAIKRSATVLGLALLVGATLPLAPTAVRIRKDPPPKKKAPCCRLGIAYRSGPGMVVLDRICASRKKTVVHLRTVRLRSVCTFPPATVIRDQKGRLYRMTSHKGLPNCKAGTSQRLYQRFVWTFKPLRRDARKITVIEMPAAETAGMGYWAWRNIKIDQCRFKL